MRVCSVSGCPTIFDKAEGSRCQAHRKEADRARGTAAERGYNSRGHRAFRAAVLQRDPICVLCGVKFSTVADHWPRSRKDLIDLGLDPNDPDYGRGLDKLCHDLETSRNQPGGFNAGQRVGGT